MDMFDNTGSRARAGRIALIVLALTVIGMSGVLAQEPYSEDIIVRLEVPRLLKQDIMVRYDGSTIYLPLIEVLSLLDIAVQANFDADVFSGDMQGEHGKFEINLPKRRTRHGDAEFAIDSTDLVLTARELYVRVDLFQTWLGLDMRFSFSTLSIYLPLSKDFPAYQQLIRKMAHASLRKKTTQLSHVKVLPRRRQYARGAVADWMLSASPVGGSRIHYFSMNAGGMLMGGDVTLSAAGNTSIGLQTDQLRGRWHYVIDDNPFVSQVEVGDINSDNYFSRGVQGAKVTNRPQVQRKFFQTVRVNDFVGEGWEVELYVNNKLTDFVYTDQSGEYDFLVDVYYGATRIMLKFYGPNGEIRTEEQYVKVPYNLIPKNDIEYSFSMGRTRNAATDATFAQGSAYYGIFSGLTAGVNAELPIASADTTEFSMAAVVDYQVLSNLIVSGAFSPNKEMRYSFNFSEPSIISISGSYTKFFENAVTNRFNQNYSAVFALSSPLRIGTRYLGLRYYLSYDKYIDRNTLSMNYGFNTSLSLLHLNYIGKYKISEQMNQEISNLSSQIIASFRHVPVVTPQVRVDYDHSEKTLLKYGVSLIKRIFRTGQLSMGYEHNVLSNANTFSLTLNIFNDIASFNSRLMHSSNQFAYSQVQRGSVQWDQETGSVRFDRRSGVGFGTAVLRPFLDENYNEVYDEGEELVPGLRAKISGVGGRPSGKEKRMYYDRLRPYDNYVVEIDPASLDNPLLKPVHEHFEVQFEPNVVTAINVPLVIGGEVSGVVTRETSAGSVGVGGLRVSFLHMSRESVTQVTTFNSGDYYYLGLLPGTYRAFIDPEQLDRYGYECIPANVEFEVKPIDGGTIVGDVNFVLKPKTEDE